MVVKTGTWFLTDFISAWKVREGHGALSLAPCETVEFVMRFFNAVALVQLNLQPQQ